MNKTKIEFGKKHMKKIIILFIILGLIIVGMAYFNKTENEKIRREAGIRQYYISYEWCMAREKENNLFPLEPLLFNPFIKK